MKGLGRFAWGEGGEDEREGRGQWCPLVLMGPAAKVESERLRLRAGRGILPLDQHGRRRAAHQQRAAAEAEAKAAPERSRPESLQPARPDPHHQWSRCQVAKASQPPRTYITGVERASGRRKLLVEIRETQTPYHVELAHAILDILKVEDLDKPTVLTLRASLVRGVDVD